MTEQADVLNLETRITRPGVSGRIDHIAYDSVKHLAFIDAPFDASSVKSVNKL